MRSVDELVRSALSLRYHMIEREQDPTTGVFHVTMEEHMSLRALPPFNHPLMNTDRDRFCGLELKTIEILDFA
jgi:hypothetical protein